MGLTMMTVIFLANLVTRNKHKLADYVLVFIIGFLISYVQIGKCHAYQGIDFNSAKFELQDYRAALDEEQIDHFEMLAKKNREMGNLCVFTAKKMIWFLPDLTDEQMSNMCLATFSVGLAPTTPWSKIIRMFIAVSVQYVGHCKNEWNHIQNLLHTAEYHFELAEFYDDVVEKAAEL